MIGIGNQHGKGIGHGAHFLPQKHKKIHVKWNNSHKIPTKRRPQASEKTRKHSHDWVGQKEKKGIRMGPTPPGGSCIGGKVPTLGEVTSQVRNQRILGGEGSNWFVEGKQRVTCTGQHHCPVLPSL